MQQPATNPCGASQKAELSKINSQVAIDNAQSSSAFKSKLTSFTNVEFDSAYEIVHWDSITSCLPLSETYTVVFSAYNSSGFVGYVHVSEIPTSLTVSGVVLQTDRGRADACSSSPCNTQNWGGWEGWNNNKPGSPYPGSPYYCTLQCNTIYEADADYTQPTASWPPTGCNDWNHCDVLAWVGLSDDEGAVPSQHLAQDGSIASCVNSGCSPSYSAFYELLTPNTGLVYCNGMPVHGGDSMYAQTLNQGDGGGNNQYYQFFINDYSTLWGCGTGGIQYTVMTIPYWADFIVERPGFFCNPPWGCHSLARFGTVTFSNAQYYCASGANCYPRYQSGEVGLYGGSYLPNDNFKVTINECNCQSGGVLNVDTGLVSSSNTFTQTWLTSQGT